MAAPPTYSRGWERFVSWDTQGKMRMNPSTRSMPQVDIKGRDPFAYQPSSAPGGLTRSQSSLGATTVSGGASGSASGSNPASPSRSPTRLRGDGASDGDVVTIEYCTAERPTASLKGTADEFKQHALALKLFLEERYPKLSVELQKPPATHIPMTELGFSFKSWDSASYENLYVPKLWQARRLPTPSEGRRRFPRINAFEVKANGRVIFSKIAGGPLAPFPKVDEEGEYVEIAAALDKMYARPRIAGFSGMDKGRVVVPVGKAVCFPARCQPPPPPRLVRHRHRHRLHRLLLLHLLRHLLHRRLLLQPAAASRSARARCSTGGAPSHCPTACCSTLAGASSAACRRRPARRPS